MPDHKPRGQPIAPAGAPLTDERLAALRDLIPQAFSEGKIDWDRLRAALGDAIDDAPERYTFSWAGKRAAMRSLQAPPAGALAPAAAESIDFDATRHVFIEGDNLEVLKLLYKAYFGRVKMIYIDPPYNTGNDFIYPDNYADPLDAYLKITGQKDSAGNLLTSNPETSGRYHSAWLSMMYPRLVLARELLRDDGVIFVSIDDHEVHNLRLLMNEVFGEQNFVGTIVWKGATDNNPTQIAVEHEYIQCFARSKSTTPGEWKDRSSDAKVVMLTEYERLRELLGNKPDAIQDEFRRFIRANREALQPITHYDRIDEVGPYTGGRKVHNPKPGGYLYDVFHPITHQVCVPPANGYRFPKETMDLLLKSGTILFGEDENQIIQIKEYLKDYEAKLSSVVVLDSRVGANELADLFGREGERIFTNPKPSVLLSEVFGFVTARSDIILDFFAGSCTTAQAVLELNREDGGARRFIMVQLPEPTGRTDYRTIADIGKERIRRVIARMQKENEGKLDLQTRDQPEDLGMRVFKLGQSVFRSWQGVESATPEGYVQQLGLSMEQLEAGRAEQDILWEVALREGYSLDARVQPLPNLPGNTVYQVSDLDKEQSFLICLDGSLHAETLAALPLRRDQVFICRDAALDDSMAANLALQCRLKTI